VLWTTTPDHKTWNTTGFVIFEPVDGDDIAAVVAFANRIGVMWSNQLSQNFSFRIHLDGDPETTWQPVEIVAQGNKIADDHLNLAVTEAQDVLAATKSGDDVLNLFVRWIDSGWDGPYFVTHRGTRPVVVFDRENEDVYTFYTDETTPEYAIAYKVANLSSLIDLALDGSTVVLSGQGMKFNDVTAMKQTVDSSTGILIVAKEDIALNAHYKSIDILPAGPITNKPPLVSAGPDQTIALPQSATLAGSASDDGLPLPAALTVLWTQLSGPATATLSTPTNPTTTVTFPLPGTYVFRLTASDGELSAADDLTLTVNEAGETTVLQIPIARLEDDVEEEASDPNFNSNDLDLGKNIVGLRFATPVPPGATIVTTYVQFVADETGSQATTLTIEGEASDDAPPFGKNAWNLTDRPRTQAAVTWIPAPWTNIGDAGLAQRTPDLAAILQELVNRPGWSSGNAVVLLFTGSGKRAAEPYDVGPNFAPFLYIEYTQGSVSNQPPLVVAGPTQTLTLPQTATLAGTVSDDGLPTPATLTTTWSQVSGPAPASISDPASLTPTVSFPAAGTYVLRLTASDGELSTSDDLTLMVNETGGTSVVQVQIARSEDDAEERVGRGDMDLDNTDLDLSQQNVGLRFALPVPPSAHIVRAFVQFTTDDVTIQSTTILVEGESSDNALPFAKTKWNVTDRLRTSAAVWWVPDPWTVEKQAGLAERTPELAPIIQEIVNRPGWSTGNALVLLFTGSGHRAAWAYDKIPTFAPVLYVEYAQ
jgi:hypothetical protein